MACNQGATSDPPPAASSASAPPTTSLSPTLQPAPIPSDKPAPSVAPPPTASSAPVGKPLPPFGELKELRLHLEQDAKSKRECDGTVYKLSIDIQRSQWLYASCEADKDEPGTDKKLNVKNGKLAAADRSTIEQRYAALSRQAQTKDCAADNMQLTLSLTKKDETTTSYVDETSRCGAASEVVPGLQSFGAALERIVQPPEPR